LAERLIVVDPGDLVTRAVACDLANPAALDRLALESAAASVHPRPGSYDDPAPAPAAPLAPAVVGMGEGGGFFEVGASAADREGLAALLAARPSAEKLEALVRAAIFALARGGDRVSLVLVADPGEKADRLEEVARALEGARPITAIAAPGAPLETRRLAISARTLTAGAALLEQAFAAGAIGDESGAPALGLDLGHRSTRLFLLDPSVGSLDHDLIPHGGESFLEHARRYTREKGVEPDDVSILREVRAGLQALTVGGLTFPVRRFFALPREELAKAIASATAQRLRRHLERGGRWPQAVLLAGGLAAPCVDTIAARLEDRGLAIARKLVLKAESATLEGALAFALRESAAPV
jgi:hypothetical protein